MRTRNYVLLCLVVAALVSLAVVYVPGLGDTIERELLGFLSRNAR
jgi:hypothetical protein